jgi:hypothetical protein
MKKLTLRKFAVAAALLGGAAIVAFLAIPDNADKNSVKPTPALVPVPQRPAGEWWKASWREGWTYRHQGDFLLSTRVRIRFDDGKPNVAWWEKLIGGAEKHLGEFNLDVKGNALAESWVLQNKTNGEVFLARFYPRTDVTRALYRKATHPSFIDEVLDAILDPKQREEYLAGMATLLGSGISITTRASPAFSQIISRFIGARADDLIGLGLQKHGIKKRDDGGIEISPDSPLLRQTKTTAALADLANFAMQLNEAFKHRMFLILAKQRSGEWLDTREIYNEGKALVTFAEKKNTEGVEKALDWLRLKMLSYNKPKVLVRGVFQRETFALSNKIFASAERKPGDTWVVDADFFNTFLHPDLKGRFRGKVVLHYVEDKTIHDRDDEKIEFSARIVEIEPKGKVNGRTVYSDLEYSEPNFTVKMRDDTDAFLFIDKDGEYVRQAGLSMKNDIRAGLPDIKILSGFDVVGETSFEIRYICRGQKAE